MYVCKKDDSLFFFSMECDKCSSLRKKIMKTITKMNSNEFFIFILKTS